MPEVRHGARARSNQAGLHLPTHDAILQEKPGTCPLDRRELVSIAVSVFWTCGDSSDHLSEPASALTENPRAASRKAPHADLARGMAVSSSWPMAGITSSALQRRALPRIL
jgi:hypothetical protein